jgi:3-oxoacyl-[acyl-carrier protein] reductase
MSDRYQQLVNTPIGRIVSKQVGLPNPVRLERYESGQPVISGPVLFGAAAGGRLARPVTRVLAAIDAVLYTPMEVDVRAAAADAGLDAKLWGADGASPEQSFKALVFDASAIADSGQLHEAWAFFSPVIRRVRESGRVIVLGLAPESCTTPRQATAQRALEGFIRALGKEVRHGSTAQLLYVSDAAGDELESSLRFFLSPRSAYVSGQAVRIGSAVAPVDPGLDWALPLAGRVALVTGAARGIGEAIAEVLARDGAHVVGLDVPAAVADLDEVAARIGGSALALDITAEDAPGEIASYLQSEHGGVDVVVHNAGVTRDKTLARMTAELWDTVININLSAQERINDVLLQGDVVRRNGRIVSVSSISGIAGNAGQANYSTSKAGVIGLVESLAASLAERGLTINAVAPGFIETRMTAAMPIATREAGRRMNSLAQGGLPVDVAETIAWFASPGSAGVNGNVVRVCGQSLLGA